MVNRRLLADIDREVVDWTCKGFPESAYGTAYSDLSDRDLNLMAGEFSYPVMVLKNEELQHNLSWMAEFCRAHGAHLAPHAKTAMAPQLVAEQIDRGAWGITLATVSQAKVFRRFGSQCIILANQLVSRADLTWLSKECREHPDVELISIVDSVDQVELADSLLDSIDAGDRCFPVLLEVGYAGGRTGARDEQTAVGVARAVAESKHFRLVGLEGFEGVTPGVGRSEQGSRVVTYLQGAKRLHERLRKDGLVATPSIVSFGGSAYFDLVTAEIDLDWRAVNDCELILRSGCYVTHDDGMYSRLAPPSSLRPALELISTITACPEVGMAIAGFGKRDAPQDAGLPIVRAVYRSGCHLDIDDITVTGLNDHHAFLGDPRSSLQVGDVLVAGISHPCTAFDKWKLIPLVEPDYSVIGAIRTYF